MKVTYGILLLIVCSSCSMTIGMTEVQKEQKKFNRFRPRQDESRLLQVVGFTGIAMGIYYNQNVRQLK